MSELLACPFCGGEAETWDGAGPWHAICKECGAIGSPCLSEAEAIATWNSRAKPPCGGGYCPLCGAAERTCKQSRLFNLIKRECDGKRYSWHGDEMPNYCPNCGAKVVGE